MVKKKTISSKRLIIVYPYNKAEESMYQNHMHGYFLNLHKIYSY